MPSQKLRSVQRSPGLGRNLIYLSNLLKCNRRHDLESPNIETLWVEIKLKEINLLLCCLYRSDFNASQSLFINEMKNSIKAVLDYIPHVILTGDIDIDFFKSY